jgi:hypothetical protein
MTPFVVGPPAPLECRESSFAPQGPDLRGDDEQALPVDEHGNRQWLVAIRLERFELVELKRPGERSVSETVGMPIGRMASEPEEAPLDRTPGHLEDLGGLAQTDAGDHEPEEWSIDVRLLLTKVGAERLTGEGASAPAATEALNRVGSTAGIVPTGARGDWESGVKI